MNTNKLMLLLVAALGMTSGVMASTDGSKGADLGVDGINLVDPTFTKAKVVDATTFEVHWSDRAVQTYTNKEFNADNLVAALNDPAQRQSTMAWLSSFTPEMRFLPATKSPFAPIRNAFAKAGTTVAQFPGRQYNNWKDGYKNGTRWGNSVRGVRDTIHVANVGNAVRELATDSNLLLDALNMNKKLSGNKNFAWLRKGKSKSARALRVLITLAQAGLIGALEHATFTMLANMVDGRVKAKRKPTIAAGGDDVHVC